MVRIENKTFTARLNSFFSVHVFTIFQTLKWPKIPEDSSDFDDSWTELIVMTWTFIFATLRFFRVFFFTPRNRGWGVGEIQIQRKSKRKMKTKTERVKQPTGGALRAPLAGSPACVFAFVFVLIYVPFEIPVSAKPLFGNLNYPFWKFKLNVN